jgi:hypothetical protein
MFYSLFNNVKGKTNEADFTHRLSFEVFHYLKHQANRSGPVKVTAEFVLPTNVQWGLNAVNSYPGEAFTKCWQQKDNEYKNKVVAYKFLTAVSVKTVISCE